METKNMQLLKWQIYQIDNAVRDIIENDVNPETGEIEYDISEQLEVMEIAREELTKNVILYYKEASAFQEAVKAEKKRLSDMDSQLTSRLAKLKLFIKNSVPEGEKIKTEQFQIGWRKSSSFEIDQNYLVENDLMTEDKYLEDLEKTNPTLIKNVRTLKKKEVGALYNETGVLPNGLIYEKDKQNIQIK